MRGALAGFVGTLAMDVLWWRRAAKDGQAQPFLEFEVVHDVDGFEEAGAPAQAAAVAADAVGIDLPASAAAPAANAAHWLTGLGWGALYGASVAARDRRWPVDGPLLGITAWATSYALLAPVGIYQPPWDEDVAVLGHDLSAHLLYGSVTAGVHRALERATDVRAPGTGAAA